MPASERSFSAKIDVGLAMTEIPTLLCIEHKYVTNQWEEITICASQWEELIDDS